MRVDVSVEGLKEMADAMAELKTATARAQSRKALTAGGELLARNMRALAPKRSGDLVESIDVSGKLSRQGRKGHSKIADQEVYVGPDDRPQAMQQEFGNIHHPPQPFMRPAWDGSKFAVLETIKNNLIVNVQQATARAQAKAKKG